MHDQARFVYIVNGKSRLHAPQQCEHLKTGDSFIMKCENFVNHWLEPDEGDKCEVMIVQFFPDMLKNVYGNDIPDIFSQTRDTEHKSVEKIAPGAMLRSFIQSMRAYLDIPKAIDEPMLKLKIKELVHIMTSTDKTGNVRAILGNLFKVRDYEFKEVVHANLYEDLKIEDLAFLSGLSLSSFKRKFNDVFGTSPNQFIKTKRLEKAKYLLETTDLRVSDIAYDSGFNDTGYFSKVFSQAYQSSPKEYRERFMN